MSHEGKKKVGTQSPELRRKEGKGKGKGKEKERAAA
jgi:hypothetical protein